MLALVIAVVAAAVCARLGIWQLARNGERRAWNREVERRMSMPPLQLRSGVSAVPADSLAYRRASATGIFVFLDEVVERNRSLQGAPGVHVLTPLRLADGTAVLVNRGWTYAPDAMTADLRALREADTAVVDGVLFPPVGRGAVVPDSLRVGYPVLPLVLRRTTRTATQPANLALAPLPPRDAGPHLSYAVQWFAFATIALVGGTVLATRSVPSRGGATPRSPAADG